MRSESNKSENKESKATFTVTAIHSKYGTFEETYKLKATANSQKQYLESFGYQKVTITRN